MKIFNQDILRQLIQCKDIHLLNQKASQKFRITQNFHTNLNRHLFVNAFNLILKISISGVMEKRQKQNKYIKRNFGDKRQKIKSILKEELW